MSDMATVYCDESGNDGPNYLNPQQPFYVLAGWAVPDDRIVDATLAIESTRSSQVPDAAELKFKTFKKSEGKREAVASLMCGLGQLGLTPIFMFAEKRFCIGAKIVETFLDPYYNPLIRKGFSWDAVIKKELANAFYDFLPEVTLRQFAAAYQHTKESTLTAALTEVIEQSRGRVNPELGQLLEGSRGAMSAIVKAELSAAQSYEKAAGTLNFPCLISYMMLLEYLARKGVVTPHRLVHDEQGPYQAGFQQVFVDHRHAADHWATMIGQEIPYGPIRAIKTFETQRSELQPLLQAADLLAGSVGHVCLKLWSGTKLTPAEQQLAQLTLPLLLAEPRLAWPLCSDRMYGQIAEFLQEAFGGGHELTQTEPGLRGRFPVLPPLASEPVPPSKRPLTLPLFAVTRASDGGLLFVPRSDEETSLRQSFVPLFTEQKTAQQFYDENHALWTMTQVIRAYDAPEIQELIQQLEAVSLHADLVIINPLSESAGHLQTSQFVENLRGIFERVIRAAHSGISDVLLQTHSINGRKATTLLLSSGEYGAAWKDDQQSVYTGITREAAMDLLIASDSSSTA